MLRYVAYAIHNAVLAFNAGHITINEYDQIIAECNDMLAIAGVR